MYAACIHLILTITKIFCSLHDTARRNRARQIYSCSTKQAYCCVQTTKILLYLHHLAYNTRHNSGNTGLHSDNTGLHSDKGPDIGKTGPNSGNVALVSPDEGPSTSQLCRCESTLYKCLSLLHRTHRYILNARHTTEARSMANVP